MTELTIEAVEERISSARRQFIVAIVSVILTAVGTLGTALYTAGRLVGTLERLDVSVSELTNTTRGLQRTVGEINARVRVLEDRSDRDPGNS